MPRKSHVSASSGSLATPRPWQIWRNTDGVRYEIGPSINSFFTCAYVSGFYRQEAKANAELIVHCVNHFDEVVAALEKIAAFTDEGASEHLERTGSYSLFDEPGSVEVARKALAAVKTDAKN